MAKDEGPELPQTPREFYGEQLRLRRERAGLTQEALSERMICSPSLIAHFETGRRKPTRQDARRLDEILETSDEFFFRMRRTLDAVKVADHFEAVMEAEKTATEIYEFGLTLVPGLLQIPAYAHEIFRAVQWHWSSEEIDKRVTLRMERAEILTDPEGPELWTVLDEGAIRRPIGGPATMADQLDHLIRVARSERRLVQILPMSMGAHAAMESGMTLMRFSEAPDVAYVEGVHTGHFMDDPAQVGRMQRIFDLLRATALSPDESLALLKSVAEEFKNESRGHLA